jgi:hypothetical protein
MTKKRSFWMKLFGFNHWKPKTTQTTFVKCSCGNELVGDAEKSFVRDVYVDSSNVMHYKCSECGEDSYWNFDFPCPIPAFKSIVDEYKQINNWIDSEGWYMVNHTDFDNLHEPNSAVRLTWDELRKEYKRVKYAESEEV